MSVMANIKGALVYDAAKIGYLYIFIKDDEILFRCSVFLLLCKNYRWTN